MISPTMAQGPYRPHVYVVDDRFQGDAVSMSCGPRVLRRRRGSVAVALAVVATLTFAVACVVGDPEVEPTPDRPPAAPRTTPVPTTAPPALATTPNPTVEATSTPTPSYALTTSATENGGVSPLPGTYTYLDGESVTVTATPDSGHRVASWGGDCSGTTLSCSLTLDADRTASVTFERITYTLTVTATGQGTVTPAGTTTQDDGDEVTLTASWSDATHDLDGWGGDCSGTASTCLLEMDGNKSVTATFIALPTDRCAESTDADCIRAIYLGAPSDYAQVTDIPASGLLTPEADGRYYVERGHQITVVTAAPLPTGYTRLWLDRTPLEFGTPSSVSFSQLIKPVGTTYTLTVAEDEDASTLITYDLTAARPHPVRPTHKPELGDVVVTTTFSVGTSVPRYDSYDTTGALTTPGSYGFLSDAADTTTVITTYEGLRDGTTMALIMHQSDAHGASQAALYDAVAAGDLFEWHKAGDCFVRYQVTEVRPDPIGSVPRKLLAVEWMTYAFTGCSGVVADTTAASVDWRELPDLGGASLVAPVIHGSFQIVPSTWTGEVRWTEFHPAPGYSAEEFVVTVDLAEAGGLPYWRDLPGWTLRGASSGTPTDPVYGYCAEFVRDEVNYRAVEICGGHAGGRYGRPPSVEPNGRVTETRIVNGYPVLISYLPPGLPLSHRGNKITAFVYDDSTESVYEINGLSYSLLGENVEGILAVTRSLFPESTP